MYGTKFKSIPAGKAVLYLSQFSAAIYLFHQMDMLILQKLIVRVLPINPFTQTLSYFAIPLFIIAFCIVLAYYLKRLCPRLYGLVTGNR